MRDRKDRGERSPRSDWSQILAYAWTQADNSQNSVLDDLRKDPKKTIIKLAEGSSEYPNVDENTQSAAERIQEQAETSPGESYSGYLPIPDALESLANLEAENLEVLLTNGITGILQFNEQADLWAKELLRAWQNQEILSNIRQDPLNNLLHGDELLKIFPLPDRPRGLDKLTIEDLASFFDDEDNARHLSGIFLIGS